MKKILLILLCIFILTSCAKKEVVDDEVDKTPEIIDSNDDVIEEPISEYSESVDPNNSWIFEGDGTYTLEGSSKKVNNWGTSSLTSNNFTLRSGLNTISFDITSDEDTSFDIIVASSYGTYLNETVYVSNGSNNYSYDLYANGSAYDTSITLNFSNHCNLSISNLFITSSNKSYDTRINQVGYLANLEKQVVFTYNPGDYFGVYDASNDELVYTGLISTSIYEKDSDETLYKGYFKDVNKEGEYYIKSEFGSYSYNFKISDDVYSQLTKDAIHFIYVQRCGDEVIDEYNNLSHPACHTGDTIVWSTIYSDDVSSIDSTGGWHDAGDYGKYLYTINETIADLLMSIIYGESSEELIVEARYGLEFLLKLQTSGGAVYNKIVTKEFSKFVSPEYDDQQLYALYSWTSSAASLAGCMGLAYEAYKDIDEDFANKCLDSFNSAIDYVYYNQAADNPENPEGFNVGTYYIGDENDERLFAYSVAYKISKDDKYLNLINSLIDESSSSDYYKLFSYVSLLDSLDKKSNLYSNIKDKLTNICNTISDEIKANAYPYTSIEYTNSSNGGVARSISRLLLGARYLKDERYLTRGAEAISYLLGENTLNLCFVYEYGYNSPHSIHNRLAVSHGQSTIKGALTLGVDQILSDGVIGNYFNDDSPIATRFVDNIDSYSNVEPTISNNSSFVLALSLLEYANNNSLQ